MDRSLGALFSGESLYGLIALKVRQKFPLRLALVHGWLFPDESLRATPGAIPEIDGNC